MPIASNVDTCQLFKDVSFYSGYMLYFQLIKNIFTFLPLLFVFKKYT